MRRAGGWRSTPTVKGQRTKMETRGRRTGKMSEEEQKKEQEGEEKLEDEEEKV